MSHTTGLQASADITCRRVEGEVSDSRAATFTSLSLLLSVPAVLHAPTSPICLRLASGAIVGEHSARPRSSDPIAPRTSARGYVYMTAALPPVGAESPAELPAIDLERSTQIQLKRVELSTRHETGQRSLRRFLADADRANWQHSSIEGAKLPLSTQEGSNFGKVRNGEKPSKSGGPTRT